MLISAATTGEVARPVCIAESAVMRRDEGWRPLIATTDAGKVRLGGGYRQRVSTTDPGQIRLGGGYRLPVKCA